MVPTPRKGIHVVVLFLMREDGRFCLNQRTSGETSYHGYWQNPGGKVEKTDAHLEEAMVREAREEAGVNLVAQEMQYLGVVPAISPKGIPYFVHSFLYAADDSMSDSAVVNAEPHKQTDWIWFNIDEALTMAKPMMPALMCSIHHLQSFLNPESTDIKSL